MEFVQSTEKRLLRVQWALLAIALAVAGGVWLATAIQIQVWNQEWSDALPSLLASPLFAGLAVLAVLTLGAGAYHRLWIMYRLNRDLLVRVDKQHRTMLRFGELSHQMVTEADLDRLLGLVLGAAIEVCDGDTGSVMLLDATGEVLRIRSAQGLPQEVIAQTALRLGEGIAGLVAKRGKPALLGRSTKDPELAPLLKRQHELRAAISAPIVLEERVIGTVNVNRLSRGGDYDEQDANALCAFAAHAALAIEKAHLFQQLRDNSGTEEPVA